MLVELVLRAFLKGVGAYFMSTAILVAEVTTSVAWSWYLRTSTSQFSRSSKKVASVLFSQFGLMMPMSMLVCRPPKSGW